MDICKIAESIKTGAQDKPLTSVRIVDCGELTQENKLSIETADYLSHYLE